MSDDEPTTNVAANHWRRIARKWERRARTNPAAIAQIRTAIRTAVDQLDEIANTLDDLEDVIAELEATHPKGRP